MERHKKLLSNILLLIGSVFFFFILAEGVTRLVMPNSVRLRLMHQPDERLGYRLVPNYEMRHQTSDFDNLIKINSEGLRDYEHPRDKDPDVFRILVLGDSFTFGVGVNVEDSYPKLLETLLNQNPIGEGKKYDVINAGIEGYGTEQEYRYLEKLWNRYKPDLVLVGLYSNDIDDVMKGIPTAGSRFKLIRKFYFFSYLRVLQISLGTMFKDIRTGFLQIYEDHYTPELENALQKTKEWLIKMRDFSYSHDAKTSIVIIPSCFEIDQFEWETKGFERFYSDEFFNSNMTRFSEIFTEFGEMKDIPTLSLLPIFRNSNKIRPLYFNNDIHWNTEGHKLAAESIYKFLEEKGLIH